MSSKPELSRSKDKSKAVTNAVTSPSKAPLTRSKIKDSAKSLTKKTETSIRQDSIVIPHSLASLSSSSKKTNTNVSQDIISPRSSTPKRLSKKTQPSNSIGSKSSTPKSLFQSKSKVTVQSNGSEVPLVKSKVTPSELLRAIESNDEVQKLLVKDFKASESRDGLARDTDQSQSHSVSQSFPTSTNSTFISEDAAIKAGGWNGPDSNFSFELPPLVHSKFPYYPYGIIYPKCKSITGTNAKKRKKEKCLNRKGTYSAVLKDFYAIATAFEPETKSNLHTSTDSKDKLQLTTAPTMNTNKKKTIQKTVAEADSKLHFKMAEMQNLFATELQQLRNTYDRLKMKPDPSLEAKIEAEWDGKKRQIQNKIEQCMDEILEDIKLIYHRPSLDK